MKKPVVSVFGSSRPGPEESQIAFEVGRELARAGFAVCNGGYGGTMEASARGAKEAGGETIGVITSFFGPKGANRWIDTTITVDTLVERLMKLIELGNAYVVLKGGTGTLLELAAVWEMMNKGVIQEKPIVVVGDFWNPVLDTLKKELAWEGLEDCTRFVSVAETPLLCASLLKQKLNITGPIGDERL